MKTSALILTLASSAYAWIYPNCEHDDCYRNLVDPLHIGKAPAFCIGWMSGTTTSTGAIPTQYRNCLGVALLSACSYITYTATRTDGTTETEASPPPLVTTLFKPETATFIPPSTSTISSETKECTIEIETSTPPAKTSTLLFFTAYGR
ncbi:hypothetical protein G3M48_003380 [Beauveria asiatica]|uniref:Uncharacterized protein n=1 Tax=Beauveria asiatica TaxID=1069075 RepID=A0AAW0RWJ8_9HYPO